jgi:PAS domain-containing protein
MPPFALPLALAVGAALAAFVAWLVVSRRRLAAELVSTRRLFADTMNIAPFAAYIKDADGRYIYVNPALLAATRDVAPHITTFIGRTDLDTFPTEQARRYMDDDREVLRQGKPIALDDESYDADGTVRRWFTMKFPGSMSGDARAWPACRSTCRNSARRRPRRRSATPAAL